MGQPEAGPGRGGGGAAGQPGAGPGRDRCGAAGQREAGPGRGGGGAAHVASPPWSRTSAASVSSTSCSAESQ
nr:hypothetical protein DWF04_04000 [Cereibacter sphaeroides f. sp. denitrificans]